MVTGGGSVSSPVSPDDPRIIAWKAYQETEEYANTRKHALRSSAAFETERHVDSALWAAFIEGFERGQPPTIEVAEGTKNEVWAAKLNGTLVGGWFENKALAAAIAADLRAALGLPGQDDES